MIHGNSLSTSAAHSHLMWVDGQKGRGLVQQPLVNVVSSHDGVTSLPGPTAGQPCSRGEGHNNEERKIDHSDGGGNRAMGLLDEVSVIAHDPVVHRKQLVRYGAE